MAFRIDTHDLGFIMVPALKRDWGLLGNNKTEKIVLIILDCGPILIANWFNNLGMGRSHLIIFLSLINPQHEMRILSLLEFAIRWLEVVQFWITRANMFQRHLCVVLDIQLVFTDSYITVEMNGKTSATLNHLEIFQILRLQ